METKLRMSSGYALLFIKLEFNLEITANRDIFPSDDAIVFSRYMQDECYYMKSRHPFILILN